MAAPLVALLGVMLALDLGGLATRASELRRWRELYRGQYSPLMMRIGGAIMAVAGAAWLVMQVRG